MLRVQSLTSNDPQRPDGWRVLVDLPSLEATVGFEMYHQGDVYTNLIVQTDHGHHDHGYSHGDHHHDHDHHGHGDDHNHD